MDITAAAIMILTSRSVGPQKQQKGKLLSIKLILLDCTHHVYLAERQMSSCIVLMPTGKTDLCLEI